MKFEIVNAKKIESDLLDIVEYYKEINPKLAKEFISRMKEASVYILKAPFSFQIKYKNVRTVLLKQFPYHIHYILNEENNQIVILAVIHSYRNPQDYSKR